MPMISAKTAIFGLSLILAVKSSSDASEPHKKKSLIESDDDIFFEGYENYDYIDPRTGVHQRIASRGSSIESDASKSSVKSSSKEYVNVYPSVGPSLALRFQRLLRLESFEESSQNQEHRSQRKQADPQLPLGISKNTMLKLPVGLDNDLPFVEEESEQSSEESLSKPRWIELIELYVDARKVSKLGLEEAASKHLTRNAWLAELTPEMRPKTLSMLDSSARRYMAGFIRQYYTGLTMSKHLLNVMNTCHDGFQEKYAMDFPKSCPESEASDFDEVSGELLTLWRDHRSVLENVSACVAKMT